MVDIKHQRHERGGLQPNQKKTMNLTQAARLPAYTDSLHPKSPALGANRSAVFALAVPAAVLARLDRPTTVCAVLALGLGLCIALAWNAAPAGSASALLAVCLGILALRERRQGRRIQEMKQSERQRLALDLHDSAIQPYIGLKLALDALRMQAAAGQPLGPGLERMAAMCSSVITDLRRCSQALEQTQASAPPLLDQIEQQARQIRQFHGVDISVSGCSEPPLGEHLRAQVLHLVREGLSNICRHTQARTGQLRLDCDGHWLRIRIANQGLPASGSFTPRSISLRAAALGGRALVQTEAEGLTAVHVHIPLH